MEDEGGAGGGRGNNNGTGSTRYVNARDLIEAHRAEAVRNNIDIPPIDRYYNSDYGDKSACVDAE